MQGIGRALNNYRTQNRKYPKSLEALENMDYYPNGVPDDPFTKQPFDYKTDGQKFTLTCLGKDGIKGGEEPRDLDIIVNEQGLIENN
ncbi:MAG: type II secretion system protein GspG [Planctomycetes bacterium]|nr:type II secretion system protein GspG [Planctomycetota bacterium]